MPHSDQVAAGIESIVVNLLDEVRQIPADATVEDITAHVHISAAILFKAVALATDSVDSAREVEADFLKRVAVIPHPAAANANAEPTAPSV